jgi:DNA-binding NarL/FixJ family response regulator
MGLEDPSAAREPSRIVVADDHPLFRSAIREKLEAGDRVQAAVRAVERGLLDEQKGD